jgi:hypothetical protein
MRGKPEVPNDQRNLVDHIAERDRLLLHQVPCHGACRSVVDVAPGEPRDGFSDVLNGHRLERRCGFVGRQLQRKRRQRPQHGAAAIGGRRHHKARPHDRVSDTGSGDQAFGFALGRAERRAVLIGRPGNGNMDKVHRAAAVADRRQQASHEIAVHGARVATGAVLQHPEAIDHEIDPALTNQPRQRGRVHRHDRKLEIEGADLLRR